MAPSLDIRSCRVSRGLGPAQLRVLAQLPLIFGIRLLAGRVFTSIQTLLAAPSLSPASPVSDRGSECLFRFRALRQPLLLFSHSLLAGRLGLHLPNPEFRQSSPRQRLGVSSVFVRAALMREQHQQHGRAPPGQAKPTTAIYLADGDALLLRPFLLSKRPSKGRRRTWLVLVGLSRKEG